MIKRLLASILLGATIAAGCHAADFFSTEKCDRLLSIGVRAAVNTSNRTIGDKAYPGAYHHENWGCGFDLGAVATLNIRDYIAIQPGAFFEHRTGSYTLIGAEEGQAYTVAQAGSRSTENLVIPVLALVRFNVTDDVRWNVEVGPYFSFLLGKSMKNKKVVSDGPLDFSPIFTTSPASFDFGFKIGTGLQIIDHWYVGAHYMAGCLDAWKEQSVGSYKRTFGGVTKGWVFSVGYDF